MAGILRTLIGTRQFGVVLLFTLFASSGAFAITPDIPRIEAGAGKGSVQQELQLGAAYFAGRGVQQDEKQAAYWYEKAANSGDAVAQLQIGYFYEAGIGVTRDPVRAAHWYQLASASGLPSAKVNLGVLYLWGVGVRKDPSLASDLFRQAAKKGCGLGANYLGDMYYFGVGTGRDATAALHWYKVGAKLHDPEAEFRLGGLLMIGSNKKQDLAMAEVLFRRSSGVGFIPAKHALGLLLANHPELKSAPRESIDLLEEAAGAGNWRSSAVLGALAREGRGIPADPRRAYFYYRVAELQGGDEARQIVAYDLSIQAGKMTRAEVATADLDAGTWMKIHPLSLQFVYKDGVDSKQFPAFALATPEGDMHAGKLIANPPAGRVEN